MQTLQGATQGPAGDRDRGHREGEGGAQYMGGVERKEEDPSECLDCLSPDCKMAKQGSLFLASFADTPFESRAARNPPSEVRFYLAEEGVRPA